MKNIVFLFLVALVFSCKNSTKLTEAEAAAVLKAELGYPKPFEIRVNLADENMRDRVKDAGLVDSGLVTTSEIKSMTDLGSPVIAITEKGQRYLLGMPEEDQSGKVRMVKVADMAISGINDISDDGEKKARVEYAIAYENITPFSVLVTKDLTKPEIRHANFVKKEKWELVKQ
ncbi:hypothetical protein [Chitinophaga barathri]|uniref:Uncharacterized protein n=1 Tax=Chitinophaga barathri TaxID=1647451 RepID=A0A3N4MI48_9BACT|nr:hypothetical protein [Chitinophaga barathri]RPD39319.1 hypothetical protein EG028_19525 [Chitinophaga barathri]